MWYVYNGMFESHGMLGYMTLLAVKVSPVCGVRCALEPHIECTLRMCVRSGWDRVVEVYDGGKCYRCKLVVFKVGGEDSPIFNVGDVYFRKGWWYKECGFGCLLIYEGACYMLDIKCSLDSMSSALRSCLSALVVYTLSWYRERICGSFVCGR